MTKEKRYGLVGKCLCGAVGVEVETKQITISVCHCEMCRRWSGMAFAGLAADEHAVTRSGETAIYRSSEWAERAFCAKCGANLWYHFLPDDRYVFMAGLFDLPAEAVIHEQIFVDHKADWYEVRPLARQSTGEEAMKAEKRSAARLGWPDNEATSS